MKQSRMAEIQRVAGTAALIALAALAAGCASVDKPAPVLGGSPRLVVVLVVDGLPERQVVDYRDQLSPDGLERFFTRGAWFTNARYDYATTDTCAGHATLFTGADPAKSGMISNEWVDPASGRLEGCVDDPAAGYVGAGDGKGLGASPRNLRVDTLGDAMKLADARSRVIAIAGKPRSAVMAAGKRGTAYILLERHGAFASTRYYMPELPQWAAEFNAGKPADRYFGVEWRALLADAAYSRSLPDDRAWYPKGGKLPRKMGEGERSPGPAYYRAMMESPFADDLELAFARAAIAGESLGRGAAPDLLVVSLSAHDGLNHAYGAESRISHDHVLQLDRMIAEFLGDLDVTVGRENYMAVLTADHGFMPAPEYSRSLGRDAGRVAFGPFIAHVNAALAKRHGEGRWVARWSAQGLLLNRELAKAKGVDIDALAHEAREAALAEPGVAAAYIRAEIENDARVGAPSFEAVVRSYDRERSPDVAIVLKPWWMWGSGAIGTTHGSPYDYDTNVPLLFYGPPWILPERIDKPVVVTDLVPTLAALMKVPAPPGALGKLLPLELTHR
ncbi:MAG TPA: alkaline phosphatase family protein [Usitatibacter sp.]|nr:alkaline phosphatase family protein [Usitatibacter sp.]